MTKSRVRIEPHLYRVQIRLKTITCAAQFVKGFMKKIPAFVRGMVTRAVEESCRKNGISRVSIEELEKIRARMPTPKLFARDGS